MKPHLSFSRLVLSNQVNTLRWRLLSILLLLLYLNLSPVTFAQNIVWDKTLGGDSYDDLVAVQQTRDKGYILGGSSNSGINGDKSQANKGPCYDEYCPTDYWIVKLKANGTKEWDKTFGGDQPDDLVTLLQTSDGGYILGGNSYSGISGDKTETNKGGTDFWIIKLKADSTKQWDKTIGGNEDDNLSSIQQTSDGAYILGGTSRSEKSGDKSAGNYGPWFTSDYWLIKLKADGTIVWDKTFGSMGDDNLRTVQLTKDGGYILGGYSNSGKSGDKTEDNHGKKDDFGVGYYPPDYWVLKLKANGGKEWDKTIGGERNDQLASIQQTFDGSYILGGSSNSDISGDKTQASKGGKDAIGQPTADYWLVKLKANGAKDWDKAFGGNNQDELVSLQLTLDGSLLLGGQSLSGKSGDKTEVRRGGADFWILKLKSDGAKEWDKTIGGNEGENLSSLQQTRDGEYMLGGTSWSGKSGDKSQDRKGSTISTDYWIVKLANDELGMTQKIKFAPILYKTVKDAPFTVSATASSGLPVTFKIVSGPAKIKNNLITITGMGRVKVKASQAGNALYQPAEATQSFLVEAATVVKIQWDKTLGGNQDDNLRSVWQTNDGGFILGGDSESSKSGDKSEANLGAWIVKVNSNGKKEWDKTVLGGGMTVLQPTREGGYILGGRSDNGGNYSLTDYRVIKLNPDGSKAWEKTFGGNKRDELTALQPTRDGGYLLGGYSYSDISGDKTEPNRGGSNENSPVSDFWVVKLDANGNKEWDKTYGGTSYDNLSSMQQTSDGGYILGGSSSSGLSGDKTENNRGSIGYPDYWIVKIKADGSKEWDKTYGGSENDNLSSLQQTSDGGYILGGNSEPSESGDISEASKGFEDYWIVKLNAAGKKEWDKIIGGDSYDYLTSVHQTSDGGFTLSGSSYSGISGDKSQGWRDININSGAGGGDYWVVKLDAAGNKVWDKTIGGDEAERLTCAQLTMDGGYILGGLSLSTRSGDKSENSRGGTDYWIVKLKEEQPYKTTWDLRYGGTDQDNLTSVIKTSDGGYLSGGYTNSSSSGDKSQASQGKNDYWVVKSDKNGKKLWDKRYGGSADDYLNRIIQTQDGGYLLGGSSLSGKSGDKSESNKGERDYWIVKVDAQGKKEWDKTFGGSGPDELIKVAQLATGEYVLGGHSGSPVSGDKSQDSQGKNDYWIIKIGRKGEKLWDKRYGGNQDEVLGSFTDTKDGGFLLGGSSWSGKSGDKGQASKGSSDYWVVKVDKDGNLLWEKTFGGSDRDEVYSVGRSHDSNLFIAGTSSSGKSGDKTQESRGGKDYWLIKLDEKGIKLWDKSFGGNQDDELRASTFTHAGHYILAGTSYSNISGDKTQVSQGTSDYWVVEVAPSGEKIADQRLGGGEQEELRTVFQTYDGGLLLGGHSASGVSGDRTQPSQGSTDYWLVKVAPITSPIVATREAMIIAGPKGEIKVNLLQAYPNPFRNQVKVNFTLPQTQQADVKVYDSQGRETTALFQGEAQANQKYEVEWQSGTKPAGMYLLKLQTPTLRQHQKLLLSR
ncbi:T9SS type A sorting domain-containing protein [Adhaeribacter radiodurans]|uniref:T9SS type A sorting domain-containing protein n=1 Tax=Adhaeribacter radiodurans TaxID=2745197 RepID=A0A7L7LED7_9BACT|nr:T9SS type A sorting domain-containing protein [Adhaeribacter radiodurans]QMU31034.1 T9SS type A sorting domain-containing protein [Adhaeribacter radiodurans]